MTDDMIMASDYYPVEELSPILAPSIFDEIYNSQLRNGDEPEFFSPSDIMNEECTYPATPIQTRSVPITGRSIYNNQYCTTDEKAIEVSTLCCNDNKLLDFGVIYEDGGQFGMMYGVENVLSNDNSVYCSGRSGVVNILMKYCGYLESGLNVDRSCIISNIVIKAPQRGYTAPCKEGLVFISNHEIDVNDTQQFDHYTEQDFKNHANDNKSTDPVAWFSLSDDKLSIINISERSGKYMLIKLLRADRGDNIDLQYIGVLGYCGSRSFESGMLQ